MHNCLDARRACAYQPGEYCCIHRNPWCRWRTRCRWTARHPTGLRAAPATASDHRRSHRSIAATARSGTVGFHSTAHAIHQSSCPAAHDRNRNTARLPRPDTTGIQPRNRAQYAPAWHGTDQSDATVKSASSVAATDIRHTVGSAYPTSHQDRLHELQQSTHSKYQNATAIRCTPNRTVPAFYRRPPARSEQDKHARIRWNSAHPRSSNN